MIACRIRLGPFFLLFALAPILSAAPIAQAVRTARPVVVDGVLQPDEWKDAARLGSFIQFEPRRGEPAQEKTEALVLYDARYIYFGFRCLDSQPSQITAQLNRRDSELLNDDARISRRCSCGTTSLLSVRFSWPTSAARRVLGSAPTRAIRCS